MEQPIALMPHHFVDIVRAHFSQWGVPPVSRIGHRLRDVTLQLYADRETQLTMVDGVDDVCATCASLIGGQCTQRIDTNFRKGAPPRLSAYNKMIDARWRRRLGLRTDDRLTARQFCELLRDRAGNIKTIYAETPVDAMTEWTTKIQAGIANYLDESRTSPVV